jgi:WG containing repeat
MVIKLQFNWVFPFTDGLAAVQVGQKWGFISR